MRASPDDDQRLPGDGRRVGSPTGPEVPHLLDERSSPNFREAFVSLAGRSWAVDAAVARIRLTGLDLDPAELDSVKSIRLLLARVDALTLRAEAEAILSDPRRARTLRHLVSRLRAGTVHIRSAPLAGWTPDFTVFRRSDRAWALLVGLHWFARPYPHRGPALASVHGREGARRAARRFEELWRRAHDIGPAILSLLERADGRSPGPGGRPGALDTARTGFPSRPPNRRKSPQEKGKPGAGTDSAVLDTPTPSG